MNDDKKDFWKTTIGKAFVPALLIHKKPFLTTEGIEAAWVTSGFVVETSGMWFWVTARHSLDELRKRVIDSPEITAQFRPPVDDLSAEIFFAYDDDRRLDPPRVSEEALLDKEQQDVLIAHEYVSHLDIMLCHLHH